MEAPEDEAGPGPGSEAQPSATFARRNRGNRGNLRKRPAGEGDEAAGEQVEEDPTKIQRRVKTLKGEPLAFSSKDQETKEGVLTAFETSRTIQTGKVCVMAMLRMLLCSLCRLTGSLCNCAG